MQEKTKAVSKQASKLGPIINKNKTEVMRNLTDRTPITLDRKKLKEADKFIYLGSTVAMNGECLIDKAVHGHSERLRLSEKA